MNAPGYFLAVLAGVTAVVVWINYLLTKIKRLENDQKVDKIKTDAKAYANRDLNALIAEANRRRNNKAPEGK